MSGLLLWLWVRLALILFVLFASLPDRRQGANAVPLLQKKDDSDQESNLTRGISRVNSRAQHGDWLPGESPATTGLRRVTVTQL